MYTQGLNVQDSSKPTAGEDAGKLARFQAKVDAELKIEPNDWMPEGYRRTLIRGVRPLRVGHHNSTMRVQIGVTASAFR
jgi:hypothetical protein